MKGLPSVIAVLSVQVVESEELADKKVEELETLYPESTMFGTLPAYGMYVRHAGIYSYMVFLFELFERGWQAGYHL